MKPKPSNNGVIISKLLIQMEGLKLIMMEDKLCKNQNASIDIL